MYQFHGKVNRARGSEGPNLAGQPPFDDFYPHNELILLCPAATINDIDTNKILLKQRELQLIKRQDHYQWQKLPISGLPSCFNDKCVEIGGLVNELPEEEQFHETKLLDFTGTIFNQGGKLLLQSGLTNLKCLHDYEKLATVLGNEAVSVHNAARWTTDVEFGRQILNGVNPVVIRRCTKLPSNFPVTNEMVKGSLNKGKTLDEEIKV